MNPASDDHFCCPLKKWQKLACASSEGLTIGMYCNLACEGVKGANDVCVDWIDGGCRRRVRAHIATARGGGKRGGDDKKLVSCRRATGISGHGVALKRWTFADSKNGYPPIKLGTKYLMLMDLLLEVARKICEFSSCSVQKWQP